MNCRLARDWLLHAESPGDLPHAPPEVMGHVRQCARCRRVLREIREVEDAWRQLPVPASAETSKMAFLARQPQRILRLRPRPWLRTLRRGLVAASVALIVGLASWLFMQPGVPAAETVLDQMVEWNAALSEADDPHQKAALYKEKAAEFAALVNKGGVPEEQKGLFTKLMENASWLATNADDPLEEASRFNELADDMIDKLAAAKDEQTVSHLAESYSRLQQKGVNANLNQLAKQKNLSEKKQAELARMLAKEEQRLQKLQKVLQRCSPRSQQHVKQAVSVTGNHSQKRKQKGK